MSEVVCPKKLREKISSIREAIFRDENTALKSEVKFGPSGTAADSGTTFKEDMTRFVKERNSGMYSPSGVTQKIRPRNPKKQMRRIISAKINEIPPESSFLTPTGDYVKVKSHVDEYEKFHNRNSESFTYDDIDEFYKKTGNIRVIHVPSTQSLFFETHGNGTPSQISAMKSAESNNPDYNFEFRHDDTTQSTHSLREHTMKAPLSRRTAALKARIEERATDLAHDHKIVFRYAKAESYDIPNLHTAGSYWKYWLLNAKKVNGNGWGVSDKTIQQNIARFIGKPFVVTAKEWFDNSEYGTYEHPYVPTNHLPTIFNHQAKFTVGIIEDVYKDRNDDYYATIRPLPKFANRTPPPFCSPAIFQLDPHEPENAISKWEALHLAGLDRDPAYGAAIAMLKGTCIGTGEECRVQFHSAKQLDAGLKEVAEAFKNKQPLKSGNYETNGKSFFLFKNEIARHSGKGLQVSNAGYDTATTYKALKHVGVDVKFDKDTPLFQGKPYNHGDFVTIPYNKLVEPPVTSGSTKKNRTGFHTNENLQKLRNWAEIVRKRASGLSEVATQPQDQQLINSITGVKSPIPKPVRGTAAHHILYKRNVKGMAFNPNNGILLDRKNHTLAHKLDSLRAKLEQRQKTAAYKINPAAEVKINPEHGRTIADAYDAMKHEPNKPEVKEAYDSLINETGEQFKQLINGGLKITKMKPNDPNPYPTSKEMHKDIEENNHLYYFPTEQGFGQGENNSDHPMMRPTEFKHDGQPMLANDVFRIVHDINGHHLGGKTTFGPKGEHQAFIQHSRMYSPIAKKALFTETAGQNNWVNFSRSHGEKNRADPKNTTFAEQKAGLLPDEIINGKFHI